MPPLSPRRRLAAAKAFDYDGYDSFSPLLAFEMLALRHCCHSLRLITLPLAEFRREAAYYADSAILLLIADAFAIIIATHFHGYFRVSAMMFLRRYIDAHALIFLLLR